MLFRSQNKLSIASGGIMSIDTAPEAGAVVGGAIGAAGLILATAWKQIRKGDDDEAKKKGEEVLSSLLRNQKNQDDILVKLSKNQDELMAVIQKLSMVLEFFLQQQKLMHEQNLKEITALRDGQRDIAGAIRSNGRI